MDMSKAKWLLMSAFLVSVLGAQACARSAPQGAELPPSAEVSSVAPGADQQPAILPFELVGVWSRDDSGGRAQCDRFRALPANIVESDQGWISMIGSLVITTGLIHAFSEYGEGNFYSVEGVENSGSGLWKVQVRVGIDTMPSDATEAEVKNYRLQLQQERLSWEPENVAKEGSSTYFRCGDVRRDVYRIDQEG